MFRNARYRAGFVASVSFALFSLCARAAGSPRSASAFSRVLSGIPEETSGRPSIEGAELAVGQVERTRRHPHRGESLTP